MELEIHDRRFILRIIWHICGNMAEQAGEIHIRESASGHVPEELQSKGIKLCLYLRVDCGQIDRCRNAFRSQVRRMNLKNTAA